MPRGIRNHNPGNVRWDGVTKWQHQVGADELGYMIFDGPEWGIRAGIRDLLTGFRRDQEDTIREIITEWAPPSENDTESYISSVSQRTGWEPDDQIAAVGQDPSPERLYDLFEAIIYHENGQQPYARWVITKGVSLALA